MSTAMFRTIFARPIFRNEEIIEVGVMEVLLARREPHVRIPVGAKGIRPLKLKVLQMTTPTHQIVIDPCYGP